MSRFGTFVQRSLRSPRLATPIHIDLGSLNTKIAVRGKLITSEPTCLACQAQTREVVAVGTDAANLLGKTPPNIEVVWPIRDGKIVQVQLLQQYLAVLLKKYQLVSQEWFAVFSRPVHAAIPAQCSPVQQDVLRKILQSLHLDVTFTPKIAALAQGVVQKHWSFFIDIGAMTTEVGVYLNDQVMAQRTVALGGDQITMGLIANIRKEYHCEVGWLTAEQIKKDILSVNENEVHRVVVRGRDVITSLPTTFQVASDRVEGGVQNFTRQLIQEIRLICQDLPPEMLAQSLSTGMYLTGGGSQLRGLSDFLSTKLKVEVVVSRTPFEDVVRGL